MANNNCTVIVKISEVEALVEQLGKAFEQHYFTILERQLFSTGVNPMQYFASRLAAKMSILKTLDLEGSLYPLWQNIEIQRLPMGEPTIALSVQCQERATEQGIERWLLSISHTPCYAAASAIAQYNITPPPTAPLSKGRLGGVICRLAK